MGIIIINIKYCWYQLIRLVMHLVQLNAHAWFYVSATSRLLPTLIYHYHHLIWYITHAHDHKRETLFSSLFNLVLHMHWSQSERQTQKTPTHPHHIKLSIIYLVSKSGLRFMIIYRLVWLQKQHSNLHYSSQLA